MSIALISTCLNEISSVIEWRTDVLTQVRQPDEINIVDAGSTDGTLDVLNAWAAQDERVKLDISPKCTVAQGRNLAIHHSHSDIIVSTDMGCRLDPKWLDAIVEPLLNDPSVMVVAGNYNSLYSSPSTIANRAESCLIGSDGARLGPDFLPSSRSIAYRRVVWEGLGGYPEDLTYAADDTVFAMQLQSAKTRMACAPTAMVWNYRPSSINDYCKEAWGYARGNGEALIFTPGIFHRLNRDTVPLLIKIMYSLYAAIRGSLVAMTRAVNQGDAIAAAYIPYFVFRRNLSGISGYEVGLQEGAVKCLSCRRRLWATPEHVG